MVKNLSESIEKIYDNSNIIYELIRITKESCEYNNYPQGFLLEIILDKQEKLINLIEKMYLTD